LVWFVLLVVIFVVLAVIAFGMQKKEEAAKQDSQRKRLGEEKGTQLVLYGLVTMFNKHNMKLIEISENDEWSSHFNSHIKRYTSKDEYKRFIDKNIELGEYLSGAQMQVAIYVRQLYPHKPDFHPITMDVAQKDYPHLVLDNFILELLYFYSFIAMNVIDLLYEGLRDTYYDMFRYSFATAGWTAETTKMVQQQAGKRLNEYARQMESVTDGSGLYKFGALASKNIFNTTDVLIATLLVQEYVTVTSTMKNMLKK